MKAVGMWLAAGGLTATTALGAEPGASLRLRHDPFNRSMIQQLVQRASTEDVRQVEPVRSADGLPVPGAAPTSMAAVPSTPTPASTPAIEPLPVLRALLRSGTRPMVNVDGKLLEIGDSIDGMRLVEIGEYSAVFLKGRKRVELALAGVATQ